MLNSIRYIDRVIYFDSSDELEYLIAHYNTDIIVVGSDWKGKGVIGEKYAKEVKFFDRMERYSTTKILKKIKKYSVD
jgi:bifunctional ADP-heptose synthase (sugar kinase/adenylyltransferase)